MPASYPGAIKTFTTKTGADIVASSHMNDAQLEVNAIETELGVDVAGSRTDLEDRLLQSLATDGDLNFTADTELTIATGAITITQNWHNVDTEADAATDDLDTINGGTDGYFLILRPNNTARTVVIRHNVGNILCVGNANFTLDDDHDFVILVYEATLAKWCVTQGSSLVNAILDGWVNVDETWTYAAASTFTVPTDQTARYHKGTRLKFTQTTVKYAVVVASSYSAPDTTVTIAVNTDYTIANAAITSPFFSYQSNPQGYPGWFNFTPVWTGFSVDPTVSARFAVVGRTCFYQGQHTLDGTSNSTALTVTAPIAALNNHYFAVTVQSVDNGGALTGPGLLRFTSSTVITAYTNLALAGWTNVGGKGIFWNFAYPI